jgi:PAS domain S-box-containing protein
MTAQVESVGLGISEAGLHAMLDTIPARLALVDRQGRHCYVNAAYCAYLRMPGSALLGRTIREIIGEEIYARMRPDPIHRQLFERCLAGETTV